MERILLLPYLYDRPDLVGTQTTDSERPTVRARRKYPHADRLGQQSTIARVGRQLPQHLVVNRTLSGRVIDGTSVRELPLVLRNRELEDSRMGRDQQRNAAIRQPAECVSPLVGVGWGG